MTMTSTPVTRLVIGDVRAVVGDRIVEGAAVHCEAGRIVDVDPAGRATPDTVAGHGLLCLPGLVDIHSDGFEREREPRRSVDFPADFALRSFEGRVRASGITTVFHGVAFQESSFRSLTTANELTGTIGARRIDPSALVDHQILFRLDARTRSAADALVPRLDEYVGVIDGGPRRPPLVSYEDHTPGQGQYRDVDQFKKAIDPASVPDGLDVDTYVEHLIVESEARRVDRDRNRAALTELAAIGRIRLLAHDCEDLDAVRTARDAGADVAEFPLSVSAAREARAAGMDVVMGAPNALRGRSHNANVSAEELVALGLCDALASDYLPFSMLGAAFRLAGDRVCSLPDAIGLVTAGPARVSGLTDRGRLEPGALADLVLVDDRHRWPQVHGVARARDHRRLALA